MPPEVLGVLPQGGATEAYQDHAMVRVMPWVLDGHITEDTTICPQDVIRLGTQLPPKRIIIHVLPS